MDTEAIDGITKRASTLLPILATSAGVIGAVIYYLLQRSKSITLSYYGLDPALVSTSFSDTIADGFTSVLITFFGLALAGRLLFPFTSALKSSALQFRYVRHLKDMLDEGIASRRREAVVAVATLTVVSLGLVTIFTPLALARWNMSRHNWLIEANLCQHYCFSYQVTGDKRLITGLPIAVGSSRLIVVSGGHRANIIDAQSLKGVKPFIGRGQTGLSQAPVRMRLIWLLLDLVNGNFQGLRDHFWH